MTGARTPLGEIAWSGLVLSFLAGFAWLAGAEALPAAPPDDGMPKGAVTFVSGAECPKGWLVASGAQGRVIVGVVDPAAAGQQVGTPLADQEDRAHTHTFAGSVSVPGDGVFALDGDNEEGANPTSYDLAGVTDPAPSGLPFLQVQVCVKP